MMAHRLLTSEDPDSEVGLLSRIVRMDAKLVGRTKAQAPLLAMPPRLPASKARHTFIKYVEAEDENEDRYVPGDGTFSNSDSDDVVPNNFKTPDRKRRGRWHDYEEEENFPRVQSADGYLSKKAMKFKERMEHKDEDTLFGRYHGNDKHTPKESSKKRPRGDGNRVESEEGEVKKLGRRARKREELLRYKAEKLAQELNMNGLERPVADNERNQHPHRNGNEAGSSRSTKVQKHSRFKEEKAKRKRESREAAEYSRRIVVTKPAHKKIKYM